MKSPKILAIGIAAGALFALTHLAIAQDSQTGSQGGPEPATHGIAGQGGGDDATLEIAPQPGLAAPKPAVKEIPGDRNFNPSEDTSSIEPSFRPGTENGTGDIGGNVNGNGDSNHPHARPYLGITVQYATQCYLGGEEHGLEVLTIDPNSPAAQAGLQARSGMTAVGAALTTLSGILPGGSILATKALGGTGAVGQGGDLIVAIDDKRVRDQSDLESAMARLKPGDTMYLTVIRPDGFGDHVAHKTIKIAVHVGAVGEPIANAASAGAESFTH
jgi:hypothetical protein